MFNPGKKMQSNLVPQCFHNTLCHKNTKEMILDLVKFSKSMSTSCQLDKNSLLILSPEAFTLNNQVDI